MMTLPRQTNRLPEALMTAMRKAALHLALVVPCGLVPAAMPAPAMAQEIAALPQENAPYEMIRTLQILQGQVAQGNTQAHQAQRSLLLHMNQVFLAAPPSTWADARNARAAVIHLLSGGHPDVVRRLLKLNIAPAVEADLLRGALAYVDGRPEEARRLLSGFDPMELPPNLGGQVALVRAALEVAENPKEAMRLLGIARLLMPGTLVEEAALRREVFVAGKLGDIEGFQSLSIRYLRRFRGSIYEGDFRRRFGLALDTLGFSEDDKRFALLESLLAEFDEDTRRGFYLRLARRAVAGGHVAIARKASERAMPLAMAGTYEETQLKLYQAAVSLKPEDIGNTRALLWSIDRKSLTPADRDLMDAAYMVLNHVRHWPEPPEGVIGEFGAYAILPPPADPSWRKPVMIQAERLLKQTSDLMTDKRGAF
jgi:chemotaxis protein MotC